jgi:CheY-like chemotaxis protein
MRVLIVDDNQPNIELAQFLLEDAGFVVDTASDAEQALAHIAGARPDLILMDIQLPGMDGLHLTSRLKADPATIDIPTVAFTAFAMKGDEEKMRAAGCDGYIAKPVDVEQFAGQVAQILESSARARAGGTQPH